MATRQIDGEVRLLAQAWPVDSNHPPVAAPAWVAQCEVADCGSMPYVQITTEDGFKVICFKHFQEIADLPSAKTRRARGVRKVPARRTPAARAKTYL